jgi:hypothetical protein
MHARARGIAVERARQVEVPVRQTKAFAFSPARQSGMTMLTYTASRLASDSSPNMQQNNRNEVDDRGHDHKVRSDLEPR